MSIFCRLSGLSGPNTMYYVPVTIEVQYDGGFTSEFGPAFRPTDIVFSVVIIAPCK